MWYNISNECDEYHEKLLGYGEYGMFNEIIVAGLSLVGTFVGSFSGMRLMSYRIEQLEDKTEKHNQVMERQFRLEAEFKDLKELSTTEDRSCALLFNFNNKDLMTIKQQRQGLVQKR